MKLSDVILEDFARFKKESEQLESELRDTYNRNDIVVSMGQYYQKDRGYGKVTFNTNKELPPSEWTNVKNFLTAKGFEITEEGNWYDEEKDRKWYPSLKFEFDV